MKKAAAIIITVLLLATVSPANAEIVTIALEATVTQVDDVANLLDGAISVDDIITGTYTYNTDMSSYYNEPYGVALSCNDFEFKTEPENVDFEMAITNDLSGWDYYSFRSYNNLSLLNGVDTAIGIERISWQLEDATGTAVDSSALPTTAPILADWTSLSGLSIRGDKTNDGLLYIESMVYSVEVVPEPSAIILLALGGCLIRRFGR